MANKEFIGRISELEALREKDRHGRARLIAVYGRRRIGKTALIEKAFENEILWKFEGLEGASSKKQLHHFLFLLSKYSDDPSVTSIRAGMGWEEALLLLAQKLKGKKCNIFFDEFQWMASMRSGLVSVFKWAWDNHFSHLENCRFVLCGSISSFIVKRVIRSKALYGRINLEINLKPFSLAETHAFFGGKRTNEEIMELYMAFGGVPRYLQEIDPDKSVVQNLERSAFSPHGFFFNEYQRLFVSHFSKNHTYEKILKVLAANRIMSVPELAESLKLKTGGTLTELVSDLALAGFVEKFNPIDKKIGGRLSHLRIHDEFLHFYYCFVEPRLNAIEQGTVKAFEILTGPLYDQWKGYALERICRKHSERIAKALGFQGIRYEAGAWYKSTGSAGTQIDLLFKRADRILTVCEIKNRRRILPEIIPQFEKKTDFLSKYYSFPIQKVLITGTAVQMPEKINEYFDVVLFAPEVLF